MFEPVLILDTSDAGKKPSYRPACIDNCSAIWLTHKQATLNIACAN